MCSVYFHTTKTDGHLSTHPVKITQNMKEKIIAALKLKFPGINLSKKRLNSIAETVEKKVIDDETKIDAELVLYNEYNPIAEIAKHDDALRNAEAKAKKPVDPAKPDDKPLTPALPDDTPEYMKGFFKKFDELTTQVATMQAEKGATSVKGKIMEQLKDKVPAYFFDEWTMPAEETGIDSFVEKVTTKFATVNQERTNEGLGILAATKPVNGAQTPVDNKAVSPEIKAMMEKKAKEFAAAPTVEKNVVITSK